jgi:hypothetical protein
MAFSDFKTVFDVSAKYGTKIDKAKIFGKISALELSEAFIKDLEYSLLSKKPSPSEISISENFIAPMIRYVAQRHEHITYWSREYNLKADDILYGTPDYLFSYTEKITSMMMGMPLICVAEAKIDDFVGAWAQALAEMVACQKLYPALMIYGFTSNGEFWQFGKLDNNVFSQDLNSYSISTQTSQIAGILDYIFGDAVQQAEAYLAKNPAST